jgi:hypothetical protein
MFTRVLPTGDRERVLSAFDHANLDGKVELFRILRDEIGCVDFMEPSWEDGAPGAVYSAEQLARWRSCVAAARSPSPLGDQLRMYAEIAVVRFPEHPDAEPLAKALHEQAQLCDAFPSLAENLGDNIEVMEEELVEVEDDPSHREWLVEYWARRTPDWTEHALPALFRTPLQASRDSPDRNDVELVLHALESFGIELDRCVELGAELHFTWS